MFQHRNTKIKGINSFKQGFVEKNQLVIGQNLFEIKYSDFVHWIKSFKAQKSQ